MRTQCRRIYSALPSQCDRICNGRCQARCDSDASPEPRAQSPEPQKGEGLFSVLESEQLNSPSPSRSLPSALTHPETLQRFVWQTLLSGLHALPENDYGRPWPYPDRRRLATLIAEHDEDHCRRAAVEAKEIVQSQGRAPNITGLFEKKLRDLAEVRSTVRESLRSAA